MEENSPVEKEDIKKEFAPLQQKVREAKLPVILVFEGWDGAGKGTMISKLISNMDPRSYQVYNYTAPCEGEERRPLMWQFWQDIPAKGNIMICDHSWYRRTMAAVAAGRVSRDEAIESISTFERQLSDDGYLIVKIFLDISKKEQKHRLEDLKKSSATSWRVTNEDLSQLKNYDECRKDFDALLWDTGFDFAPWHIVNNDKPKKGTQEALTIIRDALQDALKKGAPKTENRAQNLWPLISMPRLGEVDLSCSLTEEEYARELKVQKKRLEKLQSILYREKIPVIIGFEGWDAAGKGGAIRRLSRALDPRSFDVTPVAAPSPDALARHYLWRFWKEIPKNGHIAIFDRTWYGRVMVERIEGFTPVERCDQAYNEINEFEAELTAWGAIVRKFWLQIDSDTQLARFTDRQTTPEKQYKITDEDWRNREKWPQYEQAVQAMLDNTSTEFAPWTVVEGNSKLYARVKVMKTVADAIEERLGK